MTTLDFSDSEPTLANQATAGKTTFSGNAAFYERLQGQTKKKGIERYGWVALPVAAVAIIGIVAATSTPNKSADNIAAGPIDSKPAMAAATPAPAVVTPSQIHAEVAAAPAPVKTAQSAPAPVHVARRAAPSTPEQDDVVTRPASATQPQSVPAASVLTPAPAPTETAPAISTPAPAAEAPTPSVSAPPADAAPAPVVTVPPQSAPAPADAAPAQ